MDFNKVLCDVITKGFTIDDKCMETLFSAIKESTHRFVETDLWAEEEDEEFELRCSKIGTPLRKAWLDKNNPKPKTVRVPDPFQAFKFYFGELIESLLFYLLDQAGYPVTHRQLEVEIEGIPGHIDGICNGYLIDSKTASKFGYKKFVTKEILLGGDYDTWNYIPQLAAYYEALIAKGFKLKGAGFLAFCKETGEFTWCEVPVHLLTGSKARANNLKATLDSPVEPTKLCHTPEVEKNGNEKLPVNCSYCRHKAKCFPTLRAFKTGTGIKYLTKTVKRPQTRVDGVLVPAPEVTFTDPESDFLEGLDI